MAEVPEFEPLPDIPPLPDMPLLLPLPMLQVSEIMSTLVTLNDLLPEALPDEVPDMLLPAPSHIPWTVTSWPT